MSYSFSEVHTGILKPYKHRATYVLKPDARQLSLSIRQHGVLVPLVIREGTMEVIDGTERVNVVSELGINTVPAKFVDVDDVDAMLLHVTLNRYRGSVVNRKLAEIIRRVMASKKYDEGELRSKLGLTVDEYLVLQDPSVIRQRNIPDHKFSKAWVPVESSSRDDFRIERPTGKAESEN